jgi:hypothetical protein
MADACCTPPPVNLDRHRGNQSYRRVLALGVFGTGSGWPDVIVAAIMAGLALQGAVAVVQQSTTELKAHPA